MKMGDSTEFVLGQGAKMRARRRQDKTARLITVRYRLWTILETKARQEHIGPTSGGIGPTRMRSTVPAGTGSTERYVAWSAHLEGA